MSAAVEMDMVPVPSSSVRFPLPIPKPRGFKAAEPTSWPSIPGRLEFVRGELLYMPPCGEEQSTVTASITIELGIWQRKNPGFVVATNEAGMLLGGDVRGADAAIWKVTGKPRSREFRRTPPVLAVEVQGKYESVEAMREKADWYLDHGTPTVWLVLPESSVVLVVTADGERKVKAKERLPQPAGLAGLTPLVSDLLG